MQAAELTIFCLLSVLFLFVGIIGGWVLKSFLDTTRPVKINPLHPEFFDDNGELIPDEVVAVSIHPGMYEDFMDEYGPLFNDDDDDDSSDD
jgi:hypothetical protein